MKHLFPHPDLSVADFLLFPLPCQLDGTFGVSHISTANFWSKFTPEPFNAQSLHILKQIPVPSPVVLESCLHEIGPLVERHEIKSVICGHLPSSHPESTRQFPLWILDFWFKVSQLRKHVRIPWRHAENWAANQDLLNFHQRALFAEEIHQSLTSFTWTGCVFGFSQKEPLSKLTCYLSNKWLATTHIDQQLDLLCLKQDQLDRSQFTGSTCQIVATHFFPKIVSLFHDSRNVYNNNSPLGGARHVFELGKELADPISPKTMACGVFNVSDSHWVSLAIDMKSFKIMYGDSMESNIDVKRTVVEAVTWWISVHMPGNFMLVDLPITRQVDSFSCGVFAVNSIQHLLYPELNLLPSHDPITEHYQWFLNVVKQHNAVVCSTRQISTLCTDFDNSETVHSSSFKRRCGRIIPVFPSRWHYLLRENLYSTTLFKYSNLHIWRCTLPIRRMQHPVVYGTNSGSWQQ